MGDGVNDAPSPTRADVGIAIGAGTEGTVAPADVILARDDPRAVGSVMALSQAVYHLLK